MHPAVRRLSALAATALALASVADLADAGREPSWTVAGAHELLLDVGTPSLAGRYGFDLGPFTASVTLDYIDKRALGGGGLAGPDGNEIFSVIGTWGTDDATGRPKVVIHDGPAKRPTFTFEGVLSEDLLRIEGTHTRVAGWGGLADAGSGPLTLSRVPPNPATTAFRLHLALDQEFGGRVKTAYVPVVGAKAPLDDATLAIFGGHVLEGGRVSGRLRVAKDGSNSAKVKVRGKGWSVLLSGPVDSDGFHAEADVRSPILTAKGVRVVIPVEGAPDSPPPPPPPAPKNLLDGAVARIANGLVTITREGAPKKFFGKPADLTVQFPTSVGQAVTHATPDTSGGATPTRFFFAQDGGKTYGTALVPADVRLDVQAFSLSANGTIQVHATGYAYAVDGNRREVDVIVLARVAP